MKKFLWILVIGLVLVGCTQKVKEPEPETIKPTVVNKIDKNKDYFYVENTEEVNLHEVLKKVNREDEVLKIGDPEFEFEGLGFDIDKERAFANEKIIINIDSEDAKNLQDFLNKKYEENHLARAETKREIEEGNYTYSWSSTYLLETYSTEETVSFSLISINFKYPGHSNTEINSYVFSKKDGKQLNTTEVAVLANTDMDKVHTFIENKMAGKTVLLYGEQREVKLVNSLEDITDIYDQNIYYRIQDENNIIITDKEIIVVLEQFIALNGSFSKPTIYRIQRSALN